MSLPNKPSRIFLRLPNWVGDVCMSLPCIHALINTDCQIVICAKDWSKDLLSGFLGEFDNIQFIPISGKIYKDVALIRQYRKKIPSQNNQHDFGIILPDSLTSALTFKLAGINCAGHKDDGRSFLLKLPIPKTVSRKNTHAVQIYLHLVNQILPQIGFNPSSLPMRLQLPMPAGANQRIQSYMQEHNLSAHNFILIAPTAIGTHNGKPKIWQHYNELTLFLQKLGNTVIMVPPFNEVEIARTNAPTANLLPSLRLNDFLCLLSQAKLIICNDSGVAHMGACTNSTLLALFTVTNPQFSRPWSPNATVLGGNGNYPTLDEVQQQAQQLLSQLS